MKTLFFEPIGGIAGDMIVAALSDCGGNLEKLKDALSALPLDTAIKITTVQKNGFAGKQITFPTEQNPPCRHLSDIREMILAAGFPEKAERIALNTFQILGEAEANAHGIPLEQVHFHEIGAADTILDICSAALLFTDLEIDRVISAPLPLGQGIINCAHGTIPAPAPALNLLLKNCTVCGSPVKGETLTPTGVALLKAMNCTFAPMPAMTVSAIGCGAGQKDFEIPNLLRVYLGEEDSAVSDIVKLECTVDDMTGEELGYLWSVLTDIPVNDLQMTPIIMKKGRPAMRITVLVESEQAPEAEKMLFLHTSTIGMLRQKVSRSVMSRKTVTVTTPYGDVRYKISEKYGIKKIKPEADDLQKIADCNRMSLKEARLLCDRLFYTENK